MVVQTPSRFFWTTSEGVPGAGVTVPLKRTFLLWRNVFTVRMSVFTVIGTATTTTGLTTSGRCASATRNWVLKGTFRTLNVKLPWLSVTILLPIWTKPVV